MRSISSPCIDRLGQIDIHWFLLFDTECALCTNAARRLRDLEVQDLELKSFTEPAIIELFQRSGEPVPTEPTLVRSDGNSLATWTGLAMRLRLVRLIGIRRAADIASLIAVDVRAHTQRNNKKGIVSRRRLLGGTATGAGALIFGAAGPATASPAEHTVVTLSPETRKRVLSHPLIRTAGSVWGTVQDSEITAAKGRGETVAIIPHKDSHAFTVLDINTFQVALTLLPSEESRSLRYYLPSGTPLIEQVVTDGRVETRILTESPAQDSAEPDSVKAFTACFLGCMNAEGVDASWLVSCIGCANGSTLDCVSCTICAGPPGVKWSKECQDLL